MIGVCLGTQVHAGCCQACSLSSMVGGCHYSMVPLGTVLSGKGSRRRPAPYAQLYVDPMLRHVRISHSAPCQSLAATQSALHCMLQLPQPCIIGSKPHKSPGLARQMRGVHSHPMCPRLQSCYDTAILMSILQCYEPPMVAMCGTASTVHLSAGLECSVVNGGVCPSAGLDCPFVVGIVCAVCIACRHHRILAVKESQVDEARLVPVGAHRRRAAQDSQVSSGLTAS